MSVSLMVALGPVAAVAAPINVYWTSRSTATLNKTNVGSGTTTQLTSTNGRLQDVDLYAGTSTLYFSDWGVPGPLDPNEGAIHRIQTDGSGLGLVLGGGVIGDAVHQIALDTANNRIYFTRAVEYAHREISHVDTNGANYTQLRTGIGDGTNGWFYSGLAVDVANNVLYWGDIGVLTPAPPADGAVNSMTLTGAAPTTLVPHVDGKGRGFALDQATQTIFYTAHYPLTPTSGGALYSYDIVNDIETLLISDPGTGYWDIEIDPSTNRIWWTDNGRGQIWSANFDGSNPVVELTGLTDVYGLALEITCPISYYVDANGPNDPAPCFPGETVGEPGLSDPLEDGSLDHPFDSIQKAIDKAAENVSICISTVIVRDETYTGVGNYDIDPCGVGVTIQSENGPNNCIIDCQSEGRAFIIQSGENANTVIDGFTITDGYADGEEYYDKLGGAILCYDSSPTIENCVIKNNYAIWSGGGIFLDANSDALIRRCTIVNNTCEASGAGICSVESSPTIENCIIAHNDGELSGGASSIYDSNMTFINCTIADNSASHVIGTGGIYCWEADANITNTILWDNNCYDNNQIERFWGDETAIVSYSDVQIAGSNEVWEGIGNINTDPLFIRPEFGDYHLMSEGGRWEPVFETNGDFNNDGIVNYIDLEMFALFWLQAGPGMLTDLYSDDLVNLKDFAVFASNWLKRGENVGEWVIDGETSPCIDSGDPSSDYLLEPEPNGSRINMGAYGNTEQASKSPP